MERLGRGPRFSDTADMRALVSRSLDHVRRTGRASDKEVVPYLGLQPHSMHSRYDVANEDYSSDHRLIA